MRDFNPVTATYLGADGYNDVLQSTSGALKDYSEAAPRESWRSIRKRTSGNITNEPLTRTRPRHFAASIGNRSRCRTSATACAVPNRSALLISRVEAIPTCLDRARANLLAGKQSGAESPAWLLYAREVSLRAAGTSHARCSRACRCWHSHREDDAELYPGACGLADADTRAACDAADRAIYRYSK